MMRSLVGLSLVGCVTANQGGDYHVLLLGDWGGDSDSVPITSTETKVIAGMKQVAGAKPTSMVLLLGDNQYHDGCSSSTRDTRFDVGFEKAFTDSVWSQMPFYAVAGNHDHHRDANEQVKYHLKGSGRWNMPALSYNIDKTLPDGKTMRIVMFDSIVTAGMNFLDENGTQVEEPPADQFAASVAESWLETQLKTWDGDYLFTAAHYPVHSGCRHGSVLRGSAHDALMAKYNVNGHFAGHDHCLMHISEGAEHHVLSGAGADNWYTWSSSNVNSEAKVNWYMASNNYNGRKGGFVGMSLDAQGGYFTYYGDNGEVLYTSSRFVSRKPSPTPPTPPTPVPAPTPTPSNPCGDQCEDTSKWILNKYHNDDTLQKITGSSAAACCKLCASNSACVTWNYAGRDDICRIKSGNTGMVDAGVGDKHTSGIKCTTQTLV